MKNVIRIILKTLVITLLALIFTVATAALMDLLFGMEQALETGPQTLVVFVLWYIVASVAVNNFKW